MVSFRGQKKLGPRPDWSPLKFRGLIQNFRRASPHLSYAEYPPGFYAQLLLSILSMISFLAKYSMRFVVNVTCWTMSENY